MENLSVLGELKKQFLHDGPLVPGYYYDHTVKFIVCLPGGGGNDKEIQSV